MTAHRVRVQRDTPQTGVFAWVAGENAPAQRWGPGSPVLSGECEVIVPSEMLVLQTMEVPAAQAERIAGSLRFLIEDRLISEPERTHVASARCGRNLLCLAVLDREWLKAVLHRLREAGLAPRSAYPECLLPDSPAGAWTVVCGDDAFVRTGEWSGFALGPVERGDPPAVLSIALGAGAPGRIVLRAGRGAPAPDAKHWSRALGVPVEPGPSWAWSSESPRPALDLMQGEFAAGGSRSGRLGGLRRAALLSLLLVLAGSAGLGVEWLLKSRERAALVAEMQRIHRATLGEAVPAVDPPAQMRQVLAELGRRAGKAAPGDFLALLAAFSERALDPAADRIQHLSYEGSTLSLVLQPADLKRLEAMSARTKNSGLDVRLEAAEWNGKQAVRVKVTEEGKGWASSSRP